MIDLPALATKLSDAGLINKSFTAMTKSEILQLCTAIFSSPDDELPAEGWSKPYIKDDQLIIPHDAHPKYNWWRVDGQGVLDTLIELKAPYTLAQKYMRDKTAIYLTEEEYGKRLKHA